MAGDEHTFTNVIVKLVLCARHNDMIAISNGVVNPAAGPATDFCRARTEFSE